MDNQYITRLQGGLGNQLFQFAFAYSFAKANNISVKIYYRDTNPKRCYKLNHYPIKLYYASSKEVFEAQVGFLFLNKKITAFLLKFPFYRKLLHYKTNKASKTFGLHSSHTWQTHFHLEGYWQSESFFRDYGNEIKRQFLPKAIGKQTRMIEEQIIKSKAVSIHVRRGDYVEIAQNNGLHTLLGTDYYKDAINHMCEQIKSPIHFYIFSDDKAWVEKHLCFLENKTFVQIDESDADVQELYLMSKCNHHIIANSSFSWWGAWLNDKEKIVIAPKSWFSIELPEFKSLIPEDWIII